MQGAAVNFKLNNIMRPIYIFLLGYISLLPYYYFSPIVFFGLPVRAAKYLPLVLIVSLGLLVLAKDTAGFSVIFKTKLNKRILIYFFSTLLSGIGTWYYPISFAKAVYYGATGILVYFIVFIWKLSQEDKVLLLRILVNVAFIVSLYGVLTLFLRKDILFDKIDFYGNTQRNLFHPQMFLDRGRISSSLGNPNFLGGFLSAVFPVAFYFTLRKTERGKTINYWNAVVFMVIFAALILTFAPGAFFAVIGFFIYFFITGKNIFSDFNFRKESINIFFLGVILICALFVVRLMIIRPRFAENQKNKTFIQSLYKAKRHNLKMIYKRINYRLDSARYAFANLKTNKGIFGVGVGMADSRRNDFLGITMDNFYCLTLIESGVIVFTCMLVTFYLIIKTAVDKIRNCVLDETNRLNIFIAGGLISFLINMFFWDVFNHPTMRILFWSFVGFLA